MFSLKKTIKAKGRATPFFSVFLFFQFGGISLHFGREIFTLEKEVFTLALKSLFFLVPFGI